MFEPINTAPTQIAQAPAAESERPVSLWDRVTDPEPGWATLHPARFLAWLMVAQRDCAAIDELA